MATAGQVINATNTITSRTYSFSSAQTGDYFTWFSHAVADRVVCTSASNSMNVGRYDQYSTSDPDSIGGGAPYTSIVSLNTGVLANHEWTHPKGTPIWAVGFSRYGVYTLRFEKIIGVSRPLTARGGNFGGTFRNVLWSPGNTVVYATPYGSDYFGTKIMVSQEELVSTHLS